MSTLAMAKPRAASSAELEPWELAALRLLAEQVAIPFDQLGRFLGAGDAQAIAVARHLGRLGLADYGRILHAEGPWLWLTPRGCRLSGTGFSCELPRVGALARMRAINEIRIQISARAPEARWICRRSAFRAQGGRGHRPDGVIEIEDELHAVLALLGLRPRERLVPRLDALHRRHDALVAFAPPRLHRSLRRLGNERHWPKLIVRGLPNAPRPPQGGESDAACVLNP